MNEYMIKLSSFGRGSLVIISLVLTGIFYVLLYDDGSSIEQRIAQVRSELQIEREKEVESDIAIREVDLVRNAIEALTQQFNVVSAQLPRELQMAEVIRIVDEVASISELNVRTKEPRPIVKEQGIDVLPIQITADGKFPQIIKFLHFMTSIERIFRVQIVNMKSENEMKPGTPIRVRFDISSYRFVPDQSNKSAGGGER